MIMSLAGLIIAFNAYAQSVDDIIKEAQKPDPVSADTTAASDEAPAPTPTPAPTIKPAAPAAASTAPVTIPMPTATSSAIPGNVNKKLNLEDITVKGELLSDDRMNFVRRQREELKNRIKFRTNFRPEILQEYKN